MNRNSKKEIIKEAVCANLRQGMIKKDAAKIAGISEKTFYRWVAEDDSFDSRVEANIIDYKQTLIKLINFHAMKNGMIALKILETRFPHEWGKPRIGVQRSAEGNNDIRKLAEIIDSIVADEDDEQNENMNLNLL